MPRERGLSSGWSRRERGQVNLPTTSRLTRRTVGRPNQINLRRIGEVQMKKATQAGITDCGCKYLYRVGGAAALIAVLVFRRNLGSELVGFKGFGIFDISGHTPQLEQPEYFDKELLDWLEEKD